MPTDTAHFVVLEVDGQRYALPLGDIDRVVRAVELTPLPDAPVAVVGVVDFRGDILPVYDLRRRFGLPARAAALTDQLILARTARRTVILLADAVTGVVACEAAEWVDADGILPGLGYVQGVLRRQDGLVLIHDLDSFLSPAEETLLARAMEAT